MGVCCGTRIRLDVTKSPVLGWKMLDIWRKLIYAHSDTHENRKEWHASYRSPSVGECTSDNCIARLASHTLEGLDVSLVLWAIRSFVAFSESLARPNMQLAHGML
jgi:hypothetical protein